MSLRPKSLILATVEDPGNVRSWSGIPFALRAALERQVDTLTVFRPSRPYRGPLDVALRLALGGKPLRWPLWMTEATLRRNAAQLAAVIKSSDAQAVLSISSQCIARIDPFPVPTYMFSDAPWIAWKHTYAQYEKMPLRGPAFGQLEAATARRCNGLFFGSAWANQEAERLYFDGHATEAERGKLHETPLGANWVPEISDDELRAAIHARPQDHIDLLFVGKDWERKGGPLAIAVTQALRSAGCSATLHVVGCRPKLASSLLAGPRPVARVLGGLYQNVPEERGQLHELFLHSHLLLVPTRAECFGIIFAEAQSFGLPPVSRAIQAVPSVVLDGETGLLMHPEATAQQYAERIKSLMSDRARYLAMAESGIRRAAEVTNWDRLAEAIVTTIFN